MLSVVIIFIRSYPAMPLA